MLFQERAMSRSAVLSLFVAATMFLVLPQGSHAGYPYPHFTENSGIVCLTCHTSHRALGIARQSLATGSSGFNNICLNCHRPGRESTNLGPITPFVDGDMATPNGPSRGEVKPGKTQSSHRWEGNDTVPKAGAIAPVSIKLNGSGTDLTNTNNNFMNSLYCVRCHAVHGRADEPSSMLPPLVRVLNADDQMCLDCHRPRNTTDHVTGTHPVGVNYATVAGQNPNEYYSTPVSSNPANPSAAMKLKSGKVQCSTCHGVHFADSNSSTFDNMSSAVFGRLSSSAGYLLRTDLKGVNSSARNICTNCHITTDVNPAAKVKSHTSTKPGKEHDTQCADCHGGHVDEADKSLPNVFLVRRFMPVSSAMGKTPTVLFQYTSGARKNYNKDAYGVCVTCHAGQPSTSITPLHSSTDARVCNSCHTHKSGFSADCTNCHGYPPVASKAGGPDGYADGYQNVPGYVNEATSPHAKHAVNYSFSCVECHKGNNHNSETKTFQDVFIDKTDILAGSSAGYVAGTRTCNNVYCHSNGAPAGSPIVYKPVKWTDKITDCAACHDAAPVTNAHAKHIAKYSCATCHDKTVDASNAIKPSARGLNGAHVNNLKDVQFSGTIGLNSLSAGTYNSGTYTCSNVYCHTNGKDITVTAPVWTDSSTGQCGKCHSINASNLPGDLPAPHQAHLNTGYGPKLTAYAGTPDACYYCHKASEHIDGIVQPFNATCTTQCHNNTVPAWVSGRIACTTCHAGNVSVITFGATNVYAPDKSLASSDGHGKPSGANQPCISCHNQDSAHINPSFADKRLVSDLDQSVFNKECNFCHNDSGKVLKAKYRNMSSHFLVKDGPQAMRCVVCHDPHAQKNKNGTANTWMIRSKIAFINSSAWDVVFTNTSTGFIQADNRGICQVCHTQTKFYRAGQAEAGHPTRNCLQCHPHRAKGGAFSPSGSCDTCHGYPPVPRYATQDVFYEYPDPKYRTTFGRFGNFTNARYEDYTGGGGAHLKHVPTYAKATDGWRHCALCHSGGDDNNPSSHKATMDINKNVANVTVHMNPAANFNNSLQIIYSGAKLVNPPNNKTGSCVNVSCHFQPSPRWSKDR